MSFTLITVPASRKALKKLPKQVRQHIVDELQKLRDNPYQCDQLKTPFQAFRSFHTKLNNTQYRVVYEVAEKEKQIILRYAASRENFYKELQRLKLQPLAR